MSSIDQFSSVFRSAAKTRFRHEPTSLAHALVLTDLGETEAGAYADRIKAFLGAVPGIESWTVVDGSEAATVGELLALVEARKPDLVCTYRNLHSGAWRWPYTLGDHVEVLTQVTDVPVLLTPRPGSDGLEAMVGTDTVMAITDHLTGEDGLVSAAAAVCGSGSTLFLSHVEDEATLKRYVEALGRTPKIDTEAAEEALTEVLLKAPRDYIGSCAEGLAEAGLELKIEPIVQFGEHLSVYRQLVRQHDVKLLVFNTKDEDQLAMHGLAYPLAVELRDIPLLMR